MIKRWIATLSCCAALVMSGWLWTGVGIAATTAVVVGTSSMVAGCATNRREVRQETRTEKRVEDRYERRRGDDD